MNQEQQEQYIKTRVDNQINWLDRKSSFNQKRYKLYRTLVIILSISLPFLTGYADMEKYGPYIKFGVGVIGVIIAVIEGIIVLQKHQENWVQYRATCETLRQEKMLFTYKAGEYAKSTTPFQDFVLKIESILGNENKQWTKYIVQNEDGTNA
ncbi:MAG: DUF4231 domain-containing protein [Bacteroidota bacterium]